MHKEIKTKIINAVSAVLTIPFSIILVAALLHIPVLSVFNIWLEPVILHLTLVMLFIAAFDFLLLHHEKSKYRSVIAGVAAAGLLACAVMASGELITAARHGVKVDIAAALQGEPALIPYDGEGEYMTYEGRSYNMTVWLPKNTEEKAPILLWIHGGGWIEGSSRDDAGNCRFFSENGYLVVSAEYPLSSSEEHLYVAQQGAIAKAVLWLKYNASRLGGDVEKLCLGGGSAGGNLAVAVAARINKGELDAILGDRLPRVKAVSVCYPAVDPAAIYYSGDPVLRNQIRSMCLNNWGGSPEEYPERYAESTGALLADESMAPTLMMYGRHDHVVSCKTISGFSEKLDELGVDRYSVVFPFADHGCDSDNTIECQTWRQKTLEWFEKYCNQA